MTYSYKDNIVIAALFFVLASDWLDSWLKTTFPMFNDMNPILLTLSKTLLFGGLYWLYNYLIKE